jgi:hypothetical protein
MFTVTDSKRSKCPLCLPKGKDTTLFNVQAENYRGWLCAEHLAALIDEAKQPREPAMNGEAARQ